MLLELFTNGHRNRRAAAAENFEAAQVHAIPGNRRRRRQHGGHAAEHRGPETLDQLPDIFDRRRVAPTGRRQHHQRAARRQTRQPLRQRAAHVVQRQAEQHRLARPGIEHDIANPCLVDLVFMRMAHQFRRARGAAGVEVGGDVVALDLPARDQAVAWLFGKFRVKGQHLRVPRCADGHPVGAERLAAHHQNGLEAGHLMADALHLVPNVGARRCAQYHRHAGVGGIQNLGQLVRLQQGIDRVGNARRLRPVQRIKTLWQQGQQQADHVIRADAQGIEQVGRLRHAGQKLRVADDQRRLVRVAGRQELDRRGARVVPRADLDRFIRAGRFQALPKRHGLNGGDVGGTGQRHPLGAHLAVNQDGAPGRARRVGKRQGRLLFLKIICGLRTATARLL